MAETEEVRVEGVPMRILHAAPSGAGPHPAVVIMFHRGGFDDFTRKVADDLAGAGYVAAAPDVYHWPPVHEPPEENPLPRDPEIVKDVAATLGWLGKRADVDSGRVGILGHCMGGRMSFLGASTNRAFRACAAYYAGNMFAAWSDGGPTAFDELKGLACPVIGFFGNDDRNPSPDDANRIEAELKRLGVEHGFHRYDGAGHAFQNFLSEPRYRPDATRDSWAKTIAFLDRTLKG